MENNNWNLQLLELQNSLASSNENLLCDELEKMANLCGSQCYKKVKLLLQNSVKDRKAIKELELQLAKLQVNVSTYADKIKDKDDVIAALKMSIDLCKNSKSNDPSASSFQLTKLQSQIQSDAISLKEKDDLLKESEAKIECLTNQVKHMETLIQNNQTTLKSSSNHLWVEGKLQIEARERHIAHLINELKKKDAHFAHLLAELKKKDDQIAFFELDNNLDSIKNKEKDDLLSEATAKAEDSAAQLKEKTKRLTTLEDTIKKHSTHIAQLQSTIHSLESKLKETENLLNLTKTQTKEKEDKKTEKLLKDSKAKINGYTNTIKQLKENIADLHTAATAYKAEISSHEETIEELTAKLKEDGLLIDIVAQPTAAGPNEKSEKKLKKLQFDSGWNPIFRRSIHLKTPENAQEFYFQCTGYNCKDKEYWVGVENVFIVTTYERHELYIHLVDLDDNIRYARYDNFVIGNLTEKYKLKSLGNYTGNAGDGLRAHENKDFLNVQRGRSKLFCLASYWWHCVDATDQMGCDLNLTTIPGGRPLIWWMGDVYKSVQMLIRPFDN